MFEDCVRAVLEQTRPDGPRAAAAVCARASGEGGLALLTQCAGRCRSPTHAPLRWWPVLPMQAIASEADPGVALYGVLALASAPLAARLAVLNEDTLEVRSLRTRMKANAWSVCLVLRACGPGAFTFGWSGFGCRGA